MIFQFSLRAWHAVAPGLQCREQWQAWAQQAVPPLPSARTVALDFVPAMQRRRLNLAARLMFAAAGAVADKCAHTPVVFCSHDGEINRSFELWLSLLREGAVSPMSFGLSVHNAVAGQWSLFSGNTAEHTALCASQAGLEIAVIEACALLAEGHEQVLVLVVDEPLKAQYEVAGAVRAPFAYALALLVVPGAQYRLSRQGQPLSQEEGNYDATDWIRAVVSDGFPLHRQDRQGSWLWEK